MVRPALLLIMTMLLSYGHLVFAQSSSIRFVDERGKTLTTVEAVVQSDGLYFPIDALRGAFDPNLKQQYNSLTKRLILDLNGKQIHLRVGASSATIEPDEKPLSLSRPPLIIAGQPMLPLEFFTELIPRIYDFDVSYHPVLQTIYVKAKQTELPGLSPPSPTTPQEESLIIVDPGHGGVDTGVRGNAGALEKTIVLAVSKQVESACQQNQIPVLLTRTEDIERRPSERIEVANRNRGKLFLSLHCNASFSPQAEGIRLYVNNPRGELQSGAPPTSAAQQYAAIKMLSQVDFLTQSRQFAAILQKQLELFSHSSIPIIEAPLATLSGVYMPAVLVELGYLSNEVDQAYLTDADQLAFIAGAIEGAIQEYVTVASNPVGETANGK